jgi:hypothetical protein
MINDNDDDDDDDDKRIYTKCFPKAAKKLFAIIILVYRYYNSSHPKRMIFCRIITIQESEKI